MSIVNRYRLRKHLMGSLHLPRRFNSQGWDDLEDDCATFRRDKGKAKTMFRRGMTWQDVANFIYQTITSPDMPPYLHYGKWIAIRTFGFVVGQEVNFSSQRNSRHRYRLHRRPLYRVKVVFTEVRRGRYIVKTAYPC